MEAKQDRDLRKRMLAPVLSGASGAFGECQGTPEGGSTDQTLDPSEAALNWNRQKDKSKMGFVHLPPENKSTCNCALIFILLSHPVKTEKVVQIMGKHD